LLLAHHSHCHPTPLGPTPSLLTLLNHFAHPKTSIAFQSSLSPKSESTHNRNESAPLLWKSVFFPCKVVHVPSTAENGCDWGNIPFWHFVHSVSSPLCTLSFLKEGRVFQEKGNRITERVQKNTVYISNILEFSKGENWENG